MALSVIAGEALTEDEIVAEAYSHVAQGYEGALAVKGPPDAEIDSLRQCLRAATSIARNPQLHPIGSDA